MNQARLDYCSVGFNCQCINFIYTGASTICFGRMTKGMSRQRQRVLPRQPLGRIFRSRQSVLRCCGLSLSPTTSRIDLLSTSAADKLSPLNAGVTGIPSSQPTLFVASS
ncbi:hypothetical protein V6N12_068515 [Hibiscus sabdariffa]|uniref:Uncharacterized protein n=1 Tax=Hibiscus sabdariffa TaxID=183260 RepID=A0ABR2FQX9_9ROSI